MAPQSIVWTNKSVIEFVHGLAITARYQMAVDIDGDIDGAVAHLVLDVGEALAVLEKQGRERMAQVVETNAP